MAKQHLDDLFDARAEIRRLKLAAKTTKAAAAEARSDLAAASSRAEDILTEMEQKEGRLAFEGDEAESVNKRPRRSSPASSAERVSSRG